MEEGRGAFAARLLGLAVAAAQPPSRALLRYAEKRLLKRQRFRLEAVRSGLAAYLGLPEPAKSLSGKVKRYRFGSDGEAVQKPQNKKWIESAAEPPLRKSASARHATMANVGGSALTEVRLCGAARPAERARGGAGPTVPRASAAALD